MAQPWQFLGYQKLASDTQHVNFTNLFPAGTPATATYDFDYKLVAECLSNNIYEDGCQGGLGNYGINSSGHTYSWDGVSYQQQDINQAHNGVYTWSASPSSQTQSLTMAMCTPYYSWLNCSGTANYTRRYSDTQDNLQWGTYEFGFTKQHDTGQSFRMKGFNVQSRQDMSSFCFNHYMGIGGNNLSTTQPPSSITLQANSYIFAAGSKFWLWAMRSGNDY